MVVRRICRTTPKTVAPAAMSVLRAKRVAMVPVPVAPLGTALVDKLAAAACVSTSRPTPPTVERVAMLVLLIKLVQVACASTPVTPMGTHACRVLTAAQVTAPMGCAARVGW